METVINQSCATSQRNHYFSTLGLVCCGTRVGVGGESRGRHHQGAKQGTPEQKGAATRVCHLTQHAKPSQQKQEGIAERQ